jgi:hypothetical protein
MLSCYRVGRVWPVDFNVESSEVGDVQFIVITGLSTDLNVSEIVRRYFTILGQSNKEQVLVDIRKLEGRVSLPLAYFVVRNLPPKPPRRIKTAVLDLEANRGWDQFMEMTAANAGVALKYFYDSNEAISWLNG